MTKPVCEKCGTEYFLDEAKCYPGQITKTFRGDDEVEVLVSTEMDDVYLCPRCRNLHLVTTKF
jgi:predicted nucleic-acid-binding Zn-ribbon protein